MFDKNKIHIKQGCQDGKMQIYMYLDDHNYVSILQIDMKTNRQERIKIEHETPEAARKFFDEIAFISWTDSVRAKEYYQQKSPTY